MLTIKSHLQLLDVVVRAAVAAFVATKTLQNLSNHLPNSPRKPTRVISLQSANNFQCE